ncbi:hypothetical protein TRICI_000347 [Trichomonascus ciferrii]|uniref:Large ribosomal subunit protein uL4m n=1 Tax=Trichomonascus ciferrii TaxID=44093 RepID=A0A642VDK8_9ASCO|nr:hypothetical protein TRICI_000347 [Trichomonascus ciferrii]
MAFKALFRPQRLTPSVLRSFRFNSTAAAPATTNVPPQEDVSEINLSQLLLEDALMYRPPPFKPHAGKPPSYVLATYRSFPSLEPVRFQPVSADVLGMPVRRDILWQAVVYERDAERVGSKHIKNRTEMGYSGRKLHQQKGSGRARVGDRGSPIRHDGGRAFGRKPGFDWSTKLPFQVYAKAIRTALSYQYEQGKLFIVDGLADFVTQHQNAGAEFFHKHDLRDKKVTVIVDEFRQNLHNATKDKYGKRMEIIPKEDVNIRDILKPNRLIIESSALVYLAKYFGKAPPISSKSPRPVKEIEEKLN